VCACVYLFIFNLQQGAYWLRWWSGKEFPKNLEKEGEEGVEVGAGGEGGSQEVLSGIVNTDCHVLNSWHVDLESEGVL